MKHFASEEEVYDLYKKDDKKVVIYKKMVYDVSEFMNEHPGGPEKV
jgi:cytochrome b involved in lipid metabolism